MSITEADIADLASILDQGRDAWIHGRLSWEDEDSSISQPDDATIFGPFGGIPPGGVAPRVQPDIQRQLAARSKAAPGLRNSSVRSSKVI